MADHISGVEISEIFSGREGEVAPVHQGARPNMGPAWSHAPVPGILVSVDSGRTSGSSRPAIRRQ